MVHFKLSFVHSSTVFIFRTELTALRISMVNLGKLEQFLSLIPRDKHMFYFVAILSNFNSFVSNLCRGEFL